MSGLLIRKCRLSSHLCLACLEGYSSSVWLFRLIPSFKTHLQSSLLSLPPTTRNKIFSGLWPSRLCLPSSKTGKSYQFQGREEEEVESKGARLSCGFSVPNMSSPSQCLLLQMSGTATSLCLPHMAHEYCQVNWALCQPYNEGFWFTLCKYLNVL